MAGQTVLVTGASRGLGAATARLAAQLGANIVLTARSRDDLQAVAQQIEAAGGQALIVVGDVSVPTDCQRLVSEAIEAFAGLDAVVNNAGVLTPIAPVADADIEAVRQNWMVNVLGPFMVAQAALPYLRQRNGRILNVSSGAAVSVTSGWAPYCMAKAAINHFTRSLAEEEPEITAIAFRPGAVDTAMQATIRRLGVKGMPEDDYAHFVDYHEEGRLLPPEVPGCALAVLALHARPEWSGSFLAWNNEAVQSLVRRFACASGR